MISPINKPMVNIHSKSLGGKKLSMLSRVHQFLSTLTMI